MCIAYQAEVLEVGENSAVIRVGDVTKEVPFKGLELQKGDFVLVQFGFITDRIDSSALRV